MMGSHRDLAIAAMKAVTAKTMQSDADYMLGAKIGIPVSLHPDALQASIREVVPAEFVHRRVDIEMVWTLGDYAAGGDWSTYYDPSSPWYNVIYGAYGLRSYKQDGSAWGFDENRTPNFDEFLEISEIDYCFLTAGMFGCKPEAMKFEYEVTKAEQGPSGGFARCDLKATIPSGLHDCRFTLGDPSTYVIYGVPPLGFLAPPHSSFEPVQMVGTVFMRQATQGPQPITLAFGALCPDTPSGAKLKQEIIELMRKDYPGS